jgi:lipopolysaccharide export system permease protein
MIKLIDRLMIRGFVKSYIVCLASLLSLYIVVDLFTNLDDFTHSKDKAQGLANVVRHIVFYYGYKSAQIFDRLCEAIVLLAAMFTVAWMQRNNEQVPLLSAGVSTRRIVTPVLMCAFAMLSLAVLNQELLIPRIADRLVLDRDDPQGEKTLAVHGAYEPSGIHVTGDRAARRTQNSSWVVWKFACTIPESLTRNQMHLQAEEAHYIPGSGPRQGGWEMTGTHVTGGQAGEVERIPGVLEVIDEGHFFLFTREVDFDALTRNANWFQLASTWSLYQDLMRPGAARSPSMAVLFQMRLTRPLVGMVLVLLGLSVILRDQNRNVIISSGQCLVLCAIFFAFSYTCKQMGDYEFVSPALAAWLPVVSFGPFAVVLFDAVHT